MGSVVIPPQVYANIQQVSDMRQMLARKIDYGWCSATTEWSGLSRRGRNEKEQKIEMLVIKTNWTNNKQIYHSGDTDKKAHTEHNH